MDGILLFDLDGTLTDSQEGITRSVDHALRTVCGIETDDLSTLTGYIGPPLLDGFMDNHGLDRETAARCVAAYRARYEKIGLFENAVYPGIPEALARLSEAGLTLAVATSKPEVFSRRILDHFDLTRYFAEITGATMDGTVSTKDQVIALALERLGQPDRSRVVMVGDRHHDISGGRAHGLRTAGVLYGFGSREELTAAGADVIVPTTADLYPCLTPLFD